MTGADGSGASVAKLSVDWRLRRRRAPISVWLADTARVISTESSSCGAQVHRLSRRADSTRRWGPSAGGRLASRRSSGASRPCDSVRWSHHVVIVDNERHHRPKSSLRARPAHPIQLQLLSTGTWLGVLFPRLTPVSLPSDNARCSADKVLITSDYPSDVSRHQYTTIRE